jgi:predicted component of type VI protein secretion system
VLVWDTRTLSLGRARENDIVLPDVEASRRHAIFTKEGDRCQVGDHQTGNGTFVNGQRVTGNHTLRSGDVVAIAGLQLEFHLSAEHPARRGTRLEYASHFKTVGQMPRGANPNATMLGLADSLPSEDEDFVIERGTRDDEVADLDLDLSPPEKREPLGLELEEELGFDTSGGEAPDLASQSQSGGDPIERMRRLKSLHAEGLISDAEFAQKRARILEEI